MKYLSPSMLWTNEFHAMTMSDPRNRKAPTGIIQQKQQRESACIIEHQNMTAMTTPYRDAPTSTTGSSILLITNKKQRRQY
jgi:hypothetical protein